MFATEHFGIEPDLMTVAKSIAGGFPLAAVIGKADIMDAVPPGGLGGTYGGSPVACAAGLAVLDVIERDALCARADWIGGRIADRFARLAQHDGGIGDIRALGAMSAIELVVADDPAQPDPVRTSAVVAEARERGLLLLQCGIRGNVIRFLPPLTIEEDILDEALDILAEALAETVAPSVAA
jgi:4-aminobutyrate aminotransferase/(S)-3-amino-2-methylpropionate transaminase